MLLVHCVIYACLACIIRPGLAGPGTGTWTAAAPAHLKHLFLVLLGLMYPRCILLYLIVFFSFFILSIFVFFILLEYSSISAYGSSACKFFKQNLELFWSTCKVPIFFFSYSFLMNRLVHLLQNPLDDWVDVHFYSPREQ